MDLAQTKVSAIEPGQIVLEQVEFRPPKPDHTLKSISEAHFSRLAAFLSFSWSSFMVKEIDEHFTLYLKPQNGSVKVWEVFQQPHSDPKIESILLFDPKPKIEWIWVNIEWVYGLNWTNVHKELNRWELNWLNTKTKLKGN